MFITYRIYNSYKKIKMLLNRITVLSRLTSKDKKPKRRESEELVLNLEAGNLHKIEDKDIWENNKFKLRFRKFPWPHWIMGSMWILGIIWIMYEVGFERL